MRLLICTQAVDRNDPVLGFFHRWLEELSKHYDRIIVVCLRSGKHTLPANVEVVTLKGRFRLLRALEVCSVAFGRRREYEAVFVHMSQEYVLAAGWLWKLLGKRIYLWRNHYAGSVRTDIAAAFCTHVFHTSLFSYTANYKKSVRMPVGIDSGTFKQISDVRRVPRSILFFGRIAPSKRPELLLEALNMLRARGVPFTATLCGPGESIYIEDLKRRASELGVKGEIEFLPAVPQNEAPRLFNEHAVYVNCSPAGMYDKTLLEAAMCGCIVVSSSPDFADDFGRDSSFAEGDAKSLATTLERALAAPAARYEGLEKHSISGLSARLARETGI